MQWRETKHPFWSARAAERQLTACPVGQRKEQGMFYLEWQACLDQWHCLSHLRRLALLQNGPSLCGATPRVHSCSMCCRKLHLHLPYKRMDTSVVYVSEVFPIPSFPWVVRYTDKAASVGGEKPTMSGLETHLQWWCWSLFSYLYLVNLAC